MGTPRTKSWESAAHTHSADVSNYLNPQTHTHTSTKHTAYLIISLLSPQVVNLALRLTVSMSTINKSSSQTFRPTQLQPQLCVFPPPAFFPSTHPQAPLQRGLTHSVSSSTGEPLSFHDTIPHHRERIITNMCLFPSLNFSQVFFFLFALFSAPSAISWKFLASSPVFPHLIIWMQPEVPHDFCE